MGRADLWNMEASLGDFQKHLGRKTSKRGNSLQLSKLEGIANHKITVTMKGWRSW